MKDSTVIMTMPVCVEIVDSTAQSADIESVYAYFRAVEARFSRFKPDSELSKLNDGRITQSEVSDEMREVLVLSEETKKATNGYFDIARPDGTIDTSGLVKGWAIRNAARMLDAKGFKNFSVEIGGDIELRGHNNEGSSWRVGIRDPFNDHSDIVKVLHLSDCGVATSGTYLRGKHIYDPHSKRFIEREVVSITVVGPDVYEADRFATAAFAMGEKGIAFIEALPGFEAYQIDVHKRATFTSGFMKYTKDI